MKANELRIGNYVNIYGTDQSIDNNIMFDYDEGAWYIDDMHITLVKPIPLTEEWLLKFGFEETQSCYKKSGLKFPFSALNNGSIANYCTINNVPINISKVHKLQNLFFALTGEELKLK